MEKALDARRRSRCYRRHVAIGRGRQLVEFEGVGFGVAHVHAVEHERVGVHLEAQAADGGMPIAHPITRWLRPTKFYELTR